MNDPWTELESELSRLRPRRPSAGLEARLERALGVETASARGRRTLFWWGPWQRRAAGFLLAAAVGAGLGFGRHGREAAPAQPARAIVAKAPAAPAAAGFEPVSVSAYPYATYDAGLTRLAGGWPARRVYERSLDVYTWRNPRTNASVQWAVPCETVQLVPLDAY